MSGRKVLPPHPVGLVGEQYLASLSLRELALHNLAVERLGSSYFVEKSLGFRKWFSGLPKPINNVVTKVTSV